jgi:hypothetical protein
MRQSSLNDFTWKVRALGRPIPESRPETMRGKIAWTHAPQGHQQSPCLTMIIGVDRQERPTRLVVPCLVPGCGGLAGAVAGGSRLVVLGEGCGGVVVEGRAGGEEFDVVSRWCPESHSRRAASRALGAEGPRVTATDPPVKANRHKSEKRVQIWEKIRATSHAAIAQPAPVKKPLAAYLFGLPHIFGGGHIGQRGNGARVTQREATEQARQF